MLNLKVGDRIRRNQSNTAPWAPLGYETTVTKGMTYTDINGGKGFSINPDDWDLIAEWTDGPVRTVTRREVVPGVWSRVKWWPADEKSVTIAIAGHPDSTAQLMTASELKAAAAVLLKLAGALEE